jgi:hypothetical protein
MNDDWIIQSVSAQVYKQFPELKGIHPQLRWSSQTATHHCTLIFQTTAQTVNGKKLNRRVRVTCNADGKIQKISSSK